MPPADFTALARAYFAALDDERAAREAVEWLLFWGAKSDAERAKNQRSTAERALVDAERELRAALAADGRAARAGEPDDDGEQTMPRVGGQSFRCEDCGANVFTRRGDVYDCNGCHARYRGERKARAGEGGTGA